MDPLLPVEIDDYLDDLVSAQLHDPVLIDMERRAGALGFPIVGRATGRFLELAARLVGARHVVELGSGFGYSAAFFARAVGPEGRVTCIDGDAGNASLAEAYLRRAELWDRVDFRVGDALERFAELDHPGDLVYCDVDKDQYPAVWEAVADRLEVGGVFVCDNVLWYGRVVGLAPSGQDPALAAAQDAVAPAIRRMTRLIVDDPRYVTAVAPVRDGVLVAHRVA